jgi:hypothetical protein
MRRLAQHKVNESVTVLNVAADSVCYPCDLETGLERDVSQAKVSRALVGRLGRG